MGHEVLEDIRNWIDPEVQMRGSEQLYSKDAKLIRFGDEKSCWWLCVNGGQKSVHLPMDLIFQWSTDEPNGAGLLAVSSFGEFAHAL
jgi:hypothetical protein